MNSKPFAIIAAVAASMSLAACSAAEDKANEVVNEATNKAKDEAGKAVTKATDKAKDEATKAVNEATDKAKAEAVDKAKELQTKVRNDLLTGKKLDPNKVDQEQIKAALKLAGVPGAEKVAKQVEEARPFTADNLESKVKEIGKKNDVDDKKINMILRYLEVSK